MRVDVWADIVCPWCYLGAARFDAALSQFEHRAEVEVVYHSFELDPGQPAGVTQPVLDMLAAKYGMTTAQAAAAEGRVQGLAQAEGLDFTVDRAFGSTRAAHRLLQYAQARGHGRAMLTALYQAYFGAGRPVFDEPGLAAVAADAGLRGRPGPGRSDRCSGRAAGRRRRRPGPAARHQRRPVLPDRRVPGDLRRAAHRGVPGRAPGGLGRCRRAARGTRLRRRWNHNVPGQSLVHEEMVTPAFPTGH